MAPAPTLLVLCSYVCTRLLHVASPPTPARHSAHGFPPCVALLCQHPPIAPRLPHLLAIAPTVIGLCAAYCLATRVAASLSPPTHTSH
ncbi:hypothetical protein GUJ93_ZPchr0011g27613 [Zizania palustris]|uniref:Uncharacterized protein n=1 Tax=Zizania palustris TaxID=103762 RepID=A0A8J5WJL5_ZIZPA|nr:hypothetical protein GUJ93_ZPchr0011g27613 [Zizania palustris]